MEGAKSLTAATRRAAVVRDLNLLDVPIGQEQIAKMFGDASAALPKRLTKPDHWPDWELPDGSPDAPNGFHAQWRLWRSDPAAHVPPRPPAG